VPLDAAFCSVEHVDVGYNSRRFERPPDSGAGIVRAEDLLKAKREDIVRAAARHGAYNVRVFGSVSRGEADEASDIDLLVDMAPGRSLFDLGGLLMELRALLQREVDVVSERGLRRDIRERVLREAIPL
jgi:predicted nucleotidyltransferase